MQLRRETFGSKRLAIVDDVIWIRGMISREYPTKINKKFLNYNDYLKQTQKLLPRNYKFQFYLKTIIVFMNISSNHILDGVIKYLKKKKNVEM